MAGGCFPRRGRNTNEKKFRIRFFRYETLRIASNNFSIVLGHGGFGSVFKGALPDDDGGRTVAIKRNNKLQEGFLEMVELMSHLRHVNLIQIIGCCVENGEQLLVCEFAEKGGLSDHLHGDKWPAIDWETRAAICIGTARGLSYIHHDISPRIIHRDIKPPNIVLDSHLVPKIADFELIDFVDGSPCVEGGKQTAKVTTVTVKGTPGYMDPNYVSTGQLMEKVDVYSFGLVMLEIISGRRAVELTSREPDDRMILDWVIKARKDGAVFKIVDPKLNDFPKEDVERFINVALLCTQATSEQRPSMFEVVYMLYGRNKSDLEISEMATRAIADQPTAVSMSSLTMDISKEDETASSSKVEEPSSSEDVARMYFERSMEKIMKFHVAMHSASRATAMNQTITMNKSSTHVCMEAVYPPFLSGEYRTSRILFSERTARR